MNVEVRTMQTAAEQAAGEHFEAVADRLPGTADVAAARRDAIARFSASGLPHRRIEDWKYTDLRRFLRELPAPVVASNAPIGPETLAEIDAWRIVIVDGGEPRLPEALSELGVSVVLLADALNADTPKLPLDGWPDEATSAILDLNTAFMNSGVVLRIPDGIQLERPIQIACITTVPEAASITLRNYIEVGNGASATIVETFEGPNGIGYLINTATRVTVGRDSVLSWIKVQCEGDSAFHLATATAEIGQGASLTWAPFTTGAALSRNQMAIEYKGIHAEVNVAGVQLLGGRQHGDTTIFVDHALPDGNSRELFKTVVDGRARGVFQGKIVVRPDAQKVDGRMMTQALMLSEQAEIDNKPELEIYADDVQCGHGATSGRIDEDLLFYLRARGIPEIAAKALLIEAFVGEATQEIGNEAIGTELSRIAHDWVSTHSGLGDQ